MSAKTKDKIREEVAEPTAEEITKFIQNTGVDEDTFNAEEITRAIMEITDDEGLAEVIINKIKKERRKLMMSKDELVNKYNDLTPKEKNIVKAVGAAGIATIATGTVVLIKTVGRKKNKK